MTQDEREIFGVTDLSARLRNYASGRQGLENYTEGALLTFADNVRDIEAKLVAAEVAAAQWKENTNMIAAEAERWKAKAEAAEEKAEMLPSITASGWWFAGKKHCAYSR